MTRSIHTLAFTSALAGALGSAGCSSPELQVYLTGTVSDRFGVPISGATVRLSTSEELAESQRTTTDGDGTYEFVIDGFGTFSLSVDAEGYVRARTSASTVDFPDVEGSFGASSVRDFTLYAATASLQGRITWQNAGSSAVTGLPLRLRINDGTVSDPELVLQTITDADGFYRLESLPSGASATLFIPSWDEDGDGTPETTATSVGVFLNDDSTTVVNRNLSDFESPRAVWSNVSNRVVAPSVQIEVLYSVGMRTEPGLRDVTLTRLADGQPSVAVESNFSSDGTLLTISPVRELTEGDRYRLNVQAETEATARSVFFNEDFRVSGSEEVPAVPMNLRIADPDQDVPYDQTSFTLEWDSVVEADQYAIYARLEGGPANDWFVAGVVTASNPVVTQVNASVPSALRGPDGSALGSGLTLEFAVAARREDAESALSAPVQIRDNTCVNVIAAGRDFGFDAWNNASDSPNRVAAFIIFDGPMDLSRQPVFTLPMGLSTANFDLQWYDDDRARVIGSIAPMTDGSGTLRFDVGNVLDASGNPICEGQELREIQVF